MKEVINKLVEYNSISLPQAVSVFFKSDVMVGISESDSLFGFGFTSKIYKQLVDEMVSTESKEWADVTTIKSIRGVSDMLDTKYISWVLIYFMGLKDCTPRELVELFDAHKLFDKMGELTADGLEDPYDLAKMLYKEVFRNVSIDERVHEAIRLSVNAIDTVLSDLELEEYFHSVMYGIEEVKHDRMMAWTKQQENDIEKLEQGINKDNKTIN